MKVAVVVGTRPEIIKMSPVLDVLKSRACLDVLIHSRQHYSDSLDAIFFEELRLPPPDYSLDLGIEASCHSRQIGGILIKIGPILEKERPDVVLVQGDTNTVAAALVASKLGIPVGHVEAGLRSYDRTMPEETNRIVTDHLSDSFSPSRPRKGISCSKRASTSGESGSWGTQSPMPCFIIALGRRVDRSGKVVDPSRRLSSAHGLSLGERRPESRPRRSRDSARRHPRCLSRACRLADPSSHGQESRTLRHRASIQRLGLRAAGLSRLSQAGGERQDRPDGFGGCARGSLHLGGPLHHHPRKHGTAGDPRGRRQSSGWPRSAAASGGDREGSPGVVRLAQSIRRRDRRRANRGYRQGLLSPGGFSLRRERLGSGLGYMGLPTACLLATRGVATRGVDIDPARVESVNASRTPFVEEGMEDLLFRALSAGYRAGRNPQPSDVHIIAVPTPLQDNRCDLRFVIAAARAIAEVVRDGDLVVWNRPSAQDVRAGPQADIRR